MKMRFKYVIVAMSFAFAATQISGCAGAPDCLNHADYMDAQAFPPPVSPPGLNVPAADEPMRVPAVSDGPVGAYSEAQMADAGADPINRCLITPPAMRPSA